MLFKIKERKENSVINESFSCKHKINESNTKVFAHYGIVCLYSKHVCFCVFMSNKFFDLFRNMFNTKAVKVSNLIIFYIQSNPMCTNICIFIKIYYMCSFFYFFMQIISRVNTIESRLIFIIHVYFKVC